MREEVYKTHKYPAGYKVDKQLLLSLEDIFAGYNKELDIYEKKSQIFA